MQSYSNTVQELNYDVRKEHFVLYPACLDTKKHPELK